MLIEQSIHNLPEILVGSGYARQEYESGIVSALSLAILQELNGRNVANPISLMQAEKRFSGEFPKLRADLFVRLDSLRVGSAEYSSFGFRHNNWIEAKFFRLGKGAPPSTQNLGSVVADIIRLVALVPLELGGNEGLSITGRYFLHAYRGDPLRHLNPKRKKAGAADRAWVKKLLTVGRQAINDFELVGETKTFFTHLGEDLRNVDLRVALSNFVIEPVVVGGDEYYTIVLSRIDSGSVAINGRSFSWSANRTFDIAPFGQFENLRNNVASLLKAKPTEVEDVPLS